MIFVDKNITDLVDKGQLISDGYDPENLGAISYDLRIDYIITGEGNKKSAELIPGENVFIKTIEQLNIPKNVIGRIEEKNSRMRMGLRVDGPVYQPGHKTYAFLRVQNISKDVITISQDDKIAQIIFEELKQKPQISYDERPGASFNNENDYKHLGNYASEYQKNIKSFADVKDQIESLKERIYINVLTLMGIMVGIFSLISIDYTAVSKLDISVWNILSINFSLALCIALIFGLIHLIIDGPKKKYYFFKYLVIVVMLLALTVISLAIAKAS